MTPNLSDLIRDLEAATGPDRALDERIARACGWTLGAIGLWKSPDGEWHSSPLHFTGSLDAARGTFGDEPWALRRVDGLHMASMPGIDGFSATEPLAMCAASMRLNSRRNFACRNNRRGEIGNVVEGST